MSKDAQFSIRMNPDDHEKLVEVAKQLDVPCSILIRHAIKKHVLENKGLTKESLSGRKR